MTANKLPSRQAHGVALPYRPSPHRPAPQHFVCLRHRTVAYIDESQHTIIKSVPPGPFRCLWGPPVCLALHTRSPYFCPNKSCHSANMDQAHTNKSKRSRPVVTARNRRRPPPVVPLCRPTYIRPPNVRFNIARQNGTIRSNPALEVEYSTA